MTIRRKVIALQVIRVETGSGKRQTGHPAKKSRSASQATAMQMAAADESRIADGWYRDCNRQKEIAAINRKVDAG